MNKKKKNILFFLCLLFLFLGACFIFAQARELEIKYPVIPGIEIPATTETVLPVYVKYIFNLAIMIAGIVAFGALVFGGIRYLTSGGSPSAQKDASGQIAAAFFSLIILLSSYLILFTIDPELVVFSSPSLEKIPSPDLSPPSVFERPAIYQEIPTGYFIDKNLDKERLNKVDNLSKKIMQKVNELKSLTDDLQKLTKDCKCGRTESNPASCLAGEVCPQNIVCRGDFYSNYDPCQNRKQKIDPKKDEISKKVDEIRKLKTDLETEKEGLVKDLADLTKAEDIMINCFDQPISYALLASLKEILDIQVEKIEGWNNVDTKDEATFYCIK